MTTTKKRPTTKQAKAAEVEELVKRRQGLKVEQEDLSEQIASINEQLIDLLEDIGSKEYSFKVGKKTVKVQRVQSQPQPVLDEPRLRKKVGVTIWNKISTRRVDKNKLKAAIANGELKETVVAECSIQPDPNNPYVKVTGL
jgi:hypothetical protein